MRITKISKRNLFNLLSSNDFDAKVFFRRVTASPNDAYNKNTSNTFLVTIPYHASPMQCDNSSFYVQHTQIDYLYIDKNYNKSEEAMRFLRRSGIQFGSVITRRDGYEPAEEQYYDTYLTELLMRDFVEGFAYPSDPTITVNDVLISGTGDADNDITVTLPNGDVVATVVEADGTWNITLDTAQTGLYSVVASYTDHIDTEVSKTVKTTV